jgi:hypothetical protein
LRARFRLVFQGAARPPWGRKIPRHRRVCGRSTEWFPEAALDPFVLVGAYFRGVFRSTPIRLWCREPVG